MRTWIAWVMNGNSFILLWLFDQVNPQLCLFTSIMLLTLFPVSLIAVCSCLLSPTSIQHIYLVLSCPLPWMHSPCWTPLWIIFDVMLNMEIKEKTMSSAGCVVWIFMREPARKLNRSYERASQQGWQLTRAHSAAHPWLPAASQQSGGCVSDRAAASLPGQHKKTKLQLFLCFLFIPPFSSWSISATEIIIKKILGCCSAAADD